MKKKTFKTLALCISMMAMMPCRAQQDAAAVKPHGAPIITIFGDGGAGIGGEEVSSLGFNLERAYLGYQYKLNDHWKAKVVYDMGKGDDNAIQRMGYVKNAEVDFSHGRWGVNMGLTSTAQFNVQEKFWGYRYVYKSMMDQCKWGSSADLGVMASYKATDWLSADISVFNGEGYKKIQSDMHLLYGLGLTIHPMEHLTLRVYGDMKDRRDTVSQYNVALFAGYKCKSFRLGAEYNMQLNHGNAEGRSLSALSVYGAFRLSDNMEAYARYDEGASHATDDWTYAQDGRTAIVGVHYHVNELLSFSPNVRVVNLSSDSHATVFASISAKVSL